MFLMFCAKRFLTVLFAFQPSSHLILHPFILQLVPSSPPLLPLLPADSGLCGGSVMDRGKVQRLQGPANAARSHIKAIKPAQKLHTGSFTAQVSRAKRLCGGNVQLASVILLIPELCNIQKTSPNMSLVHDEKVM